MSFRLAAVAIALGLFATAAGAQPAGGGPAGGGPAGGGPSVSGPAVRGMAACRADVLAHCAGVEAGGGKRIACLKANIDKLSPECSATVRRRAAEAPGPSTTPPAASTVPPPAVSAAKAKGGRLAACKADVKQLCAGVAKGGGAKMRCLQDNQSKLSAPCAQTIAEIASTRKADRSACAEDAKSVCPGLKGAQRRACFTDNQAKLSPQCASALAKRAAR